MTGSEDACQSAADRLNELLGFLKESGPAEQVVEHLLEDLLQHVPPCCTHAEFHDLMAGFVGLVYAEGLPARRVLTPAEALAEAIRLFEAHYPE